MASTDTPDPETGKSLKSEEPPAPATPTAPPTAPPPRFLDWFKTDVSIRVLLFAATLTSFLLMVTSKQTELIQVPGIPFSVPLSAKFNHSPAFIYFVVALVVACFYSIITTLVSISVILKPAFSTHFTLYLALLDVVMLGIVASATGTAGGIAYVGLKGNSHVRWNKICNVYDNFCRYVGSSIALSLFASVLLLLLSYLSISSLHKNIRD